MSEHERITMSARPAPDRQRGRWDVLAWFASQERILSRDDLAWAIDEWRREAHLLPACARTGSIWRPRPKRGATA